MNPDLEEASQGVFVAREWGVSLTMADALWLAEKARRSPNGRARICLHPSVSELEQQMLIALRRGEADPIHLHPSKRETLLPVVGEADYVTCDSNGTEIDRKRLAAGVVLSCMSQIGINHYLDVISETFVFWEFSLGPFEVGSTVRLSGQ